MRRRSKFNQPIRASRWATWADQFIRRLQRTAAVRGNAPLWRTPVLARARTFFQQRQLLAYLRVPLQLNLSISAAHTSNIGAGSIYAPHLTLLRLFARTVDDRRTLGRHRSHQPGETLAPPRQHRQTMIPVLTRMSTTQLAISHALTRTQKEYLSTNFHRRLLMRGQNDLTEVSKRITHRTQRRHEVSEISELRQLMALRKQGPAPFAASQPRPEAASEFASLERPSRAPSISEITMPAMDVEQLTTQVLKQIDRRVIARRERLGQI